MANKPSLAEGLSRVWAASGSRTDPDTQEIGKFANGWNAETPPFEAMNFIQHYTTKLLAHLVERGVLEWDSNTIYVEGSVVVSPVNRGIYLQIISTPGANFEPSVNPTRWQRLALASELNSDVILNESLLVNGSTITNALDQILVDYEGADSAIQQQLDTLGSDGVFNESSVSGGTLSEALTQLNFAITAIQNELASNHLLRVVQSSQTIPYAGANVYTDIAELSSTSSTNKGISLAPGERAKIKGLIRITLSSLSTDTPFNIRLNFVGGAVNGTTLFTLFSEDNGGQQYSAVNGVSGDFTVAFTSAFVSGNLDFICQFETIVGNTSASETSYLEVEFARTTTAAPTNNAFIDDGSWVEYKTNDN